MFRFKDTIIPLNKGLRESLGYIYGIGRQRASYACDLYGFGLKFNVNNLNRYFFENFSIIFKNLFLLEERLGLFISQRLSFFFDIGRIRGKRYFRGLPVRGQRTHTNGKTPARLSTFNVD